MKKTIAKIEHRDYVPYGYLANKYCTVTFHGDRAEEMRKKFDIISYDCNLSYHYIFNEYEEKIQDCRDKENIIREQVSNSRPFYRFWYTKKEKELLDKANYFLHQAIELDSELSSIKNNKYFNSVEFRKRIELLLKQNGFVLTESIETGNTVVVITDIWTCEE